MIGMNPYTGEPLKTRTIEDCMREIRRMKNKNDVITTLRARLKSARELFLHMRGAYEHNEVSAYWRSIDTWLAEDREE